MRAVAATVMLVTCIACADASSPQEPEPDLGPPGITILEGANVSDTIGKRAGTLVVQVRTVSGHLAVGSRVEIRPLETDRALVSKAGSELLEEFIIDTTDGEGRAEADVWLNRLAGTAEVQVALLAPGLLGAKVAEYTVLPGMAVGAAPLPADTVLALGASFTFRSGAFDRFGNIREDPIVSFAADSAAATATTTGVVTANAIGRAAFRAVGPDGEEDTVWVSVPPTGSVAAVVHSRLVILSLDGQTYDSLRTEAAWVDWAPEGDSLVFGSSDGAGRIYLIAPGGTQRRLLGDGGGLDLEYRPQFSGDGQSIVFAAFETGQGSQTLWRVSRDGSGAVRVGPVPGVNTADAQPTPSHDGSRIAYVTNRCCYPFLGLSILSLGSGTIDSLAPSALVPRWSPGDSLIAFTSDDGIHVIRPDGDALRTLSPAGRTYNGLDWSPTGDWIVTATAEGYLELIRLSDGLILPLRHHQGLSRPSWRP